MPFLTDALLFGREGACFGGREVFGTALFGAGGGGMATLSDRNVDAVVVVEARLDSSLLPDLSGERPSCSYSSLSSRLISFLSARSCPILSSWKETRSGLRLFLDGETPFFGLTDAEDVVVVGAPAVVVVPMVSEAIRLVEDEGGSSSDSELAVSGGAVAAAAFAVAREEVVWTAAEALLMAVILPSCEERGRSSSSLDSWCCITSRSLSRISCFFLLSSGVCEGDDA